MDIQGQIGNMEQLIERVKTALDANRQDEAALTLYWDFIQAATEAAGDEAGEAQQAEYIAPLLAGAYRRLYAAWSAQPNITALGKLVEAACHKHFADGETLALLANGEFQARRDEQARRLYDRLLTLHALDAQTYNNLKAACFRRQPFDDFSNLLLQQCLAAAPADLAIVRFLFAQYLLHEKYAHAPFAPPVYQKIFAVEPDNLTACCALSECYYRQGKYADAIALGEKGLQTEKQHPDLLTVLAKAYYKRGEYGKVVAYCHTILAKRPGRADIHVLLAKVYAKNALTTNDALKTYKLALQAEPANLPIRQALLRAYLRKLMIAEAIAECEQILTGLHDQYDPESRDFRGFIKEMIGEYERAMRRSPGDIPLYLITARLHEYLGHFNKALIYYRTILELPLDPDLIQRLLEFLEKLAALNVQNPHLYLYLGVLYHKIQRPAAAKAAFRMAMYSDLDEREIEDIFIKHDRSLWQYPPVLVILAHHRIVTKDILEGLAQIFKRPDREDWQGALWVLQELYDVADVIAELPQIFGWDSFRELYPQMIDIMANNGSRLALQALAELLRHELEAIRLHALHALMELADPFADQCLSQAARENPHAALRLELAQFYAQQFTEQATYHLTNMLHDEAQAVRLGVVQALQQRDAPPEPLREALFTEQDAEVRIGLIKLLARRQSPDEAHYLARLFNDLAVKRQSGGSRGTGPAKMYSRLKKLIGYADHAEDLKVLSTLIQALGALQAEQAIYGLITIAVQDSSQLLRLEAIAALGQIGSPLGAAPLQEILHAGSESQDIRTAAEQALEQIIQRNR